MKKVVLPDGSIRILFSFWNPKKGMPDRVQETLPPNASLTDIIRAENKLLDRAEEKKCSLKVCAKFEDIVDIVVRENEGAGMMWIYDRIKEELAGPIDDSFTERYYDYIDKLTHDEEKAKNTIANHVSCIQRCLNTAYRRKLIDDTQVRDFSIERTDRDVVLTTEQRQVLENIMQEEVHPLYWSVRMAESRPIRKGDLWRLTRENLKLLSPNGPYIELKAQKTRNRKNPLIFKCPLSNLPDILEYFTKGLPPDCPYLFPRLTGDIKSVHDFDGMRKAQWERIKNPKSWQTLKKRANIEFFHWHDFKRMATTSMMDEEGYSEQDLVELEFYASNAMIKKCYKKKDGFKVLNRRNHIVVPIVEKIADRLGT